MNDMTIHVLVRLSIVFVIWTVLLIYRVVFVVVLSGLWWWCGVHCPVCPCGGHHDNTLLPPCYPSLSLCCHQAGISNLSFIRTVWLRPTLAVFTSHLPDGSYKGRDEEFSFIQFFLCFLSGECEGRGGEGAEISVWHHSWCGHHWSWLR